VSYGKALAGAKLLGVAKLIEAASTCASTLLHTGEHPLAGVSGAYNAVFLESDSFDNIMLFGPARRHADRSA